MTEGLRERVLAGLKWGWSPEQVANELRREEGRTVTSDESIYRFVYAQAARHKDHDWRRYLPRAKWKRGRRGRRGGSSVSFIPLRRPVAERPAAAADRRTFEHWEADRMQFGRSGEVVLALHERSSRLLLLARAPSKEAGPVAESIARILGPLLLEFRQTVTLDNGTEFTRHHELHRLGIETFFCDTYSPWQKGGVENAIGRLRRFLPRGTKLAEVSDERFAAVGLAYNNTPRKCLGYQTSAQVFEEQVLHFKCGFTFPLSRQRRRGKAADAVLLGRGHGRGAGQAPRSAAGSQSPQPRPCSSGRTPWCRLWRRIRSARSARPEDTMGGHHDAMRYPNARLSMGIFCCPFSGGALIPLLRSPSSASDGSHLWKRQAWKPIRGDSPWAWPPPFNVG